MVMSSLRHARSVRYEFLLCGSSQQTTFPGTPRLALRPRPLRSPSHAEPPAPVSLQVLDMSNQDLSVVGMEWLAKGLTLARHLTTLDLSHNNLGDDGAKYLGDLLKNNVFLRHLNASHCGIGSKGGMRVAAAFMTQRVVEDLDISYNPLGDDAGERLARCLGSCNVSLRHIRLCGTGIGERSVAGFGQLLAENSTLLSLNFAENPAADCGLMALNLERNRTLTSLILDGGGGGGRKVMWALQRNRGLKRLELTNFIMDEDAAYNLNNALKRNNTLQELLYPAKGLCTAL